MPGFITHLSFGEQSLHYIDDKITLSLLNSHPTVFGLGLQGPDIFFYHLPAYLSYKRNIGNVMHSHRVMLFFENLCNARNSFEEATDKEICDAYIIGFMGHYTLDVWCHPYIYYKSKHFEALKVSSAYDFGQHVSLETDIDHVVLAHYKHLLPNQFDYAAAVRPSAEEMLVISQLLFEAIDNTFPDQNIKYKTISGAIKSFVNLNHAMHDPKGRKKRFVRSIEQIVFKCAFISSMIPSDTIIKNVDPCNENHMKWYNIWAPAIESCDSIFDLINKAMPEYLEKIKLYMQSINPLIMVETECANSDDIAKETNCYLHYRNKLLAALSDLSYLSGLPLNRRQLFSL